MQRNYKIFSMEELVLQYQATQDETVLQELITRNKGLLWMWVSNYKIPNYDKEDLLEESYIALWKAAQAYDCDRGYTFTSYLKGCVTQSFNKLYTCNTRQKRYNGSSPISYESLEEINRQGGYQDDHSRLDLCEFMQSLPATAKKVAEMLLAGYNNGDMAKALCISPSSVTYHCKRIKKAYNLFYAEV